MLTLALCHFFIPFLPLTGRNRVDKIPSKKQGEFVPSLFPREALSFYHNDFSKLAFYDNFFRKTGGKLEGAKNI